MTSMMNMMNMTYMTSMKYMKWTEKVHAHIGVNYHGNCLHLHTLHHHDFGFMHSEE